MRRDPQS